MDLSRVANFFSKSVSIIIAVLFLAGGLLLFFRYDPAAYDGKTTGTITEIEEYYETVGDDEQLACTPYINYTVGDTAYTRVVYPQYSSFMKVGDTVDVYYMTADPTRITGSDKDLAPYFGLGFAAIGLVLLAVTAVRIVRRKPM